MPISINNVTSLINKATIFINEMTIFINNVTIYDGDFINKVTNFDDDDFICKAKTLIPTTTILRRK
jgi:hypothetical protein